MAGADGMLRSVSQGTKVRQGDAFHGAAPKSTEKIQVDRS